MKQINKKIYNFFLDLIFPQNCIGCGKYGEVLCPLCQKKIRIIKTFVCTKCGRITKSGQFCPSCRAKSNLTGLMVAAGYDKGPTKELIHHFKYDGMLEIAPILGGLLISRLRKSSLRGKLVLVPVPLHYRRQRQRGFNQAEILARYISRRLNISGGLALKRKRKTKSQVELSGRERRKNLAGAFFCKDRELIKGKTVILVDDVSTTGATLEECAKVLRTAGARQVWGLVVARG